MICLGESTKQCCKAYIKFIGDYPDYDIDVKVCVYSSNDLPSAKAEYEKFF